MLRSVRQFTRSWVARVFLAVMAVALGGFGVSKYGSGIAGPAPVVHGDGFEVSAQEFASKFDRQIRILKNQAKAKGQPAVTKAQAIEAGAQNQFADRLATDAAFDHLGKKLGLDVNNDVVLDAIQQIPAFAGENKKFDANAYQKVLADNEVTQLAFESDMRSQIGRLMLQQSLLEGVRAPTAYSKLLYLYGQEKRTLGLAMVTLPRLGPVPAPTPAEVQDFYTKNAAAFTLPEFRTLTLAIADPADFEAKVDVPEDQLKKAYEIRAKSETTPETRSFVQLSGAASKAVADQAALRIARGEDPRKIAAELRMQVLEVTDRPKDQAPDPRVAEAAFALQPGQSTAAIDGLTWSVAKVLKVTPGHTPSYDELRPKLRSEAAKAQAQDLMDAAQKKYDEARDSGASFEKAVADAGFRTLQTPMIEEHGQALNGQPFPLLQGKADLLKAAFAAPKGDVSDWTPLEATSSAVFRVDAIRKKGPPPLDEIRPAVEGRLRNQKVVDGLTKIASDVQADVQAGMTLEAAAKKERVDYRGVQSFVRAEQRGGPAPMLMAAAFSAAQGKVVIAPGAGPVPALFIAHVQSIERPDPNVDPAQIEANRQQLGGALQRGLAEASQAAARRNGKVKINQKAIAHALNLDNKDDQNQ